MPKNRAITGFGPTSMSLASATTGSWVRFGPFLGNRISVLADFVGTSNGQRFQLQGALTVSTASTGSITSLTTFNSSNQDNTVRTGGSTNIFSYIRLRSTALSTSGINVFFSALA